MAKPDRISVTIKDSNGKRSLEPSNIVCVSCNDDGATIKRGQSSQDVDVAEKIDSIVNHSNGALIKLSPVGFAMHSGKEDTDKRGAHIAVNIDALTISPVKDKRGTVVSIDGAERDIVVLETEKQIEALINGD